MPPRRTRPAAATPVLVAASDFPGETFRALKEKKIRQFGHYRTRQLVLQSWAEGKEAR
ncbi:MAG: hypothetical protein BIP78_0169 [Candidatus Bipolaricaulis sibiricus]|uniref:Uncharacterized protein n=1 Tax=Bipolaricaulis sibiricus TaxID=2501609 RepID=A0A410FSB9_BIPS1|nr:MAG: hypothetical protein BIP78_0169 [Candidatus Bipolaricaulis sibiricus]